MEKLFPPPPPPYSQVKNEILDIKIKKIVQCSLFFDTFKDLLAKTNLTS